MHIMVVGANHKTAPIEFRERLTFQDSEIADVLRKICGLQDVHETALISTCNRTEVYAVVEEATDGYESIFDFICQYHNVDKDKLRLMTYSYVDLESVRHLFRVASSLDSMVVGETQISGQVKEAYEASVSVKSSKEILARLFSKAASVNKRVRSETSIGAGAVSISYAAVELAKKIFGEVHQKRALIVGAGKMSELTLKHLVATGIKEVTVTNRTFERAVKLAQSFEGKAVPFDDDFNFMLEADIAIVSTNANSYIIDKDKMSEIMKRRKHKSMFLIDISVPRNVDPEVNKVDNIYLYNVDDLQHVVDSNLNQRIRESEKGEKIVEEEANKFHSWFLSLDLNPTIVALRDLCEEIREAELEKCRRIMGPLTKDQEDAIEAMTKAIINKVLHTPISNLKQVANSPVGRVDYISTLQSLFGLKSGKREQD